MPTEILTQDDLNTMNDTLEALRDVEDNLKRAELADLDVSAQRKRLDDTRNQIIKIKQAYFPNQ